MIPCALIGLGRIASLLEDDLRREKPATHAGAISAHPDTYIAGGADTDPERRRLFAERWGVESLYEDPALMIRELRPQILHICTHADSHLDYLELAVKEQVPVVVLEKPVADSISRARRMQGRLAGSSTRVVVNHERRYSKDYLRVRELIRSARYGVLRSVTGKLFMGRERPVEAILLYDATHLFDIVAFLCGEPIRRLRRIGGRRRGEHSVFVGADCGAVPIMAEVGRGRDHLVFSLELSFERGMIRVGNGIYEEWESDESPYYEKMRSLMPVECDAIGPTGYFVGMFADAVRLLRTPEGEAVSGYREGVESLRIVQQMRRGLRI